LSVFCPYSPCKRLQRGTSRPRGNPMFYWGISSLICRQMLRISIYTRKVKSSNLLPPTIAPQFGHANGCCCREWIRTFLLRARVQRWRNFCVPVADWQFPANSSGLNPIHGHGGRRFCISYFPLSGLRRNSCCFCGRIIDGRDDNF
jgi:hypothetical protein